MARVYYDIARQDGWGHHKYQKYFVDSMEKRSMLYKISLPIGTAVGFVVLWIVGSMAALGVNPKRRYELSKRHAAEQ